MLRAKTECIARPEALAWCALPLTSRVVSGRNDDVLNHEGSLWSVRLPKPISSHQSWISSVCVWACVWRVRGCRCAFRSAPDAASLPKPLLDFSNHLKSLGFQAKPDYAYLESCLDGAVGGGAPSQHVYEFQPARAAAAADATGLGTSQGGGEPSDHLDRGACVVTPSSPSSPPPPPPLSSLLRARARERERERERESWSRSPCSLDASCIRHTSPSRTAVFLTVATHNPVTFGTGCDPLCICSG